MSERRALVLASAVPGAAPCDRVAGLPLVLRAVLTLQRRGVDSLRVVTDAASRAAVEQVLADPRVRPGLELVTASSHEDAVREAVEAAPTPLLVTRHDVVVAPAVYDALLGAPAAGARTIVARVDGQRAGPRLVSPGAEAPELEVELDVPGAWALEASTPEGRREAVRQLFEACRKPVDGLVSRHLNRHVSIFLSKRLVETPVTPNAVSAVTFALGVAAALCVARGGYAAMLVGAVLFQWNSILDGVDGELARVRFQGSKLGEWIDTVSDDASNVLFYAGLGLGARAMGLEWLGWTAFGAALLGVLTAALYYAELVRLGSGDFYALAWTPPRAGLVGSIETFFRLVLKKDFFILLFVGMAVLGALPWAGPIMLLGTTITACAAIVRTVRRWLRPRRDPKTDDGAAGT